jgi:hypothetical protein
MMRRKFACCFAWIALTVASLPVAAATNYQDMWWNPAESGWGINITQQDNTMFAVWFVYGATGQPLWLVMSNAQRSGTAGNTFIGELFQTTGTAFSTTPFVPSQSANIIPIGKATFVFSDARTGSLTYDYSINNSPRVTVVKSITRQNLSNISLTGTYFGGVFRTATCTNSGVSNSTFQIDHTPATGAVRIVEAGGNLCLFTGTTTQFGSVVEAAGNYQCQGETGTWTGKEGIATESSLSIKLALQTGAGICNATFGGFKSP